MNESSLTTDRHVAGEPPRVSVLVPSYNHAQFVAMTLRSIMKQTHAPAKLLVIDDGSGDHSPQVIEEALKDCPFACELIVRENRGLCATLNQGLEGTKGEFFAYLGSDDVWLPNFLEERVRLLQARRHAVLAYGHAYLIDYHNRIVDCTADWADYVEGDAREMLLQAVAPMSPTVVYRRAALDKERWNEDAKLEDYDLYLRLSIIGPFAFDEQVLSAWRRHAANTSWDQTMMLEEQLKAQRAVAARIGLSEDELQKLQTATRFRRADDFTRIGDKRHALKLIRQNISGIRSAHEFGRTLLRVLIPSILMDRRNQIRARRAHERYGSIEI